MQPIKSLLAIVLLLVVAAGGVYVAINRGLIPAGPFTKVINIATQLQKHAEVAGISNSVTPQIQVLSSKAESTASQAGAVLGSHIQADESRIPMTQKAFEYARFSYCQAVVTDYQARYQPASPEPTPDGLPE